MEREKEVHNLGFIKKGQHEKDIFFPTPSEPVCFWTTVLFGGL